MAAVNFAELVGIISSNGEVLHITCLYIFSMYLRRLLSKS